MTDAIDLILMFAIFLSIWAYFSNYWNSGYLDIRPETEEVDDGYILGISTD